MIGYVGLDNQGLGGIEAAYNPLINGRSGTALIQTDARRHVFSRTERPPTTGATVQLTIDQMLQWIAERELKAGVLEHRAKGGTAIIMDPWTGEILAMANEPTFNPNAFAAVLDKDLLKNRAVQDIYEPGSTFKVVTASAALQEKVVKPTDIIDVSHGSIPIGDRAASTTCTGTARLSFEDVIVKSSNVGAIKVGFRVGAERHGPLCAPVRVRQHAVARSARRVAGHRLVAVERQRPGVGVDGLPDRRHAASDGHGRQLGRQRRPPDGAAPGTRDRPRWQANAGAAEGAARDDHASRPPPS